MGQSRDVKAVLRDRTKLPYRAWHISAASDSSKPALLLLQSLPAFDHASERVDIRLAEVPVVFECRHKR